MAENYKTPTWAERFWQKTKSTLGKVPSMRVLGVCLATQTTLAVDALALDGTINQTSSFGSCSITTFTEEASDSAGVFVSPSSPPTLVGGGAWLNGVVVSFPAPNATSLSNCVAGSTPDEFINILQDGVDAVSYADETSISLSFDFRGQSYSYSLTGATGTVANLSPSITDFTVPTVSSVSVPANATYTSGQSLEFTVTFDESVIVDTASGTPQLAAMIGTSERQATYVSGSGTTALLFRYTVQAGDNDTNGIAIGALSANGGSLQDAVGNNANLALNGVGLTTGVLVDALMPSITLGPLTPTGSGTFTSAITLSEPASGNLFEQTDLSVGNGSATLSGSGTSFTATITPAADGLVTLNVAAAAFTDAAGNSNVAATQVSANFSATEPAIALGALTPTGSGTFTSAITLSEPASGNLFEQTDLIVGNGSATLTGSGTGFTATVTPAADGLVTLDVAAGAFTNFAGNGNTAASQARVTFDGTPPTIALGALTPTGSGTLTSAITLSEPASGNFFDQSDLTVGNGSATLAGSGTNFVATITPAADGLVTLDVAASAFTDAAGNNNTAATQVSTNFDGTRPTITLGPLTLTASNTLTSAITLSEPASGNLFEQSDLTVGNGSVILTGSGTSFTATITPFGEGQVSLDVTAGAFTDAAGNLNTSDGVSVLFDILVPTVTLGPLTPTGLGTLTSIVTISENAVGNFLEVSDLVVGNGSADFIFFSGSDTTYLATITPTADGLVTLDIPAGAFTDASGKGNTASNQVSFVYDGTPPSIDSVGSNPPGVLGAGDTLFVGVTFDEVVATTGTPQIAVDIGGAIRQLDIVPTAAPLTNVRTFIYTIQPGDNDADGITIVSLDLNGGTIRDAAGNDANLTLNSVASTVGVLVDTTAPTITLGALTATGSGTLTSSITLSEPASGSLFDQSDLAVGNGSATLAGSGTSFVATITPTADGLVTLDVAAAAFTDVSGNENTTATQVSTDFDGTSPTLTLGPLTDTGSGTFTSDITLSEPAAVNLFEQSDLTVGNGSATLTGSGTSFTATISPTADGLVTLGVAAAAFTDAAGNENTAATQVSTTFDGTAPSITLGALTAAGGGTFISAITLSEPASGNLFEVVDLIVSNGSATLIGSGTTFTATLTPQQSGQLLELSVAAGAFTDAAGNNSIAADSVSVLIDVVERTRKVIANVLESNARITLQNQPKLGRRLDRLAGRTRGTGSVSAFGASITNSGLPIDAAIGESGGTFSYSLNRARQTQGKTQISANPFSVASSAGISTSQSSSAHSVEEVVEGRSGNTKNTLAEGVYALVNPERFLAKDVEDNTSATLPRYDVWIEGAFGRLNTIDGQSDYAIIHAGADYLLKPNLLVGIGAQFDWTDYVSNSSTINPNANANSFGFLIGPYLTAKLNDQLYLDARVSIGQSQIDVSPLGTFSDEVTTDRTLASIALIGEMEWNDIIIRPELRANYYNEVSEAYTDSLGFTVDGVSYETGVLEFGPSFEKSYLLDNGMIATPKLSFDGIWTFAERNTGTIVDARSGTGVRGKIEAGLDIATSNGFNFTISGLYDGIGEPDYEAFGGSVSISKRW